jgi:hypothetical protein
MLGKECVDLGMDTRFPMGIDGDIEEDPAG